MGIWDKLRGELVDIIEWLDDTRDTIVWRFPRYENEIKYGAKLIVREGQVAAFVNQGRWRMCFKPGTFTLQTANLPIFPPFRAGNTALKARLRRRSISSTPGRLPIRNGERKTPSCCAMPNSARCGCGRLAHSRFTYPIHRHS